MSTTRSIGNHAAYVRTLARRIKAGGSYAKRAEELIDNLDGMGLDRDASELAYAVFAGRGMTAPGVRHANTPEELDAALARIEAVAASLEARYARRCAGDE